MAAAHGSDVRIIPVVLSLGMAACMVGEDEATEGTPGASVTTVDHGLTGCRGQAASSIPASGQYILTTFGGPGDHQPMSCGGYADGTGWYAASRQRYGCGSKVRVEANGKCAVVVTDDYGPDVCVENAVGKPILDVSPKVSRHLFGEAGAGWSDRLLITATEVDPATPVGICAATPTGGGTPAVTCASATLDRDVTEGTCVQSAATGEWQKCSAGAWVARGTAASCTASFSFCASATLGRDVAPRTCVQARSDNKWYQCNGQGWVTPVNVTAASGPIGACATMNAL